MDKKKILTFDLPDKVLTSLPTGAVKDTVEQLGKNIVQGVYETNAILPREEELVETLGVSRTVVREAVKVLCGKGLVRTARRYGSRVCAFESWNLLDPDVIRWHDPNSPRTARIYTEADGICASCSSRKPPRWPPSMPAGNNGTRSWRLPTAFIRSTATRR